MVRLIIMLLAVLLLTGCNEMYVSGSGGENSFGVELLTACGNRLHLGAGVSILDSTEDLPNIRTDTSKIISTSFEVVPGNSSTEFSGKDKNGWGNGGNGNNDFSNDKNGWGPGNNGKGNGLTETSGGDPTTTYNIFEESVTTYSPNYASIKEDKFALYGKLGVEPVKNSNIFIYGLLGVSIYSQEDYSSLFGYWDRIDRKIETELLHGVGVGYFPNPSVSVGVDYDNIRSFVGVIDIIIEF